MVFTDHVPKVSVIMPVYNGEAYLREAIDSILNQSLTDFELIIINDGSTDRSLDIATSFEDSRIRTIDNSINLKLIKTLNKGLDYARGQYIARMDCDDIAMPDRLEKQIEFLDRNPEVGICGSWIRLFGARSEVIRYPVRHEEIKARLFFECMLAHPAVVIRKSLLDNYELRYDEADLYAEDFGLWQRCSHITKIVNLPEVLLNYRVRKDSISHVYRKPQMETEMRLAQKSLRLLGIEPTDADIDFFFAHLIPPLDKPAEFLPLAEKWHEKLLVLNKERKVFPIPEFDGVISRHWFEVCYKSTHLGSKAWKVYWSSPLRTYSDIPLIRRCKFFIKCMLKRDKHK